MSVIVSPAFKEQLATGELANYSRLQDLAKRLETITPQSLHDDPSINRLHGVKEELYVLRFHNLRIFLTANKDNVIILHAMEHG